MKMSVSDFHLSPSLIFFSEQKHFFIFYSVIVAANVYYIQEETDLLLDHLVILNLSSM